MNIGLTQLTATMKPATKNSVQAANMHTLNKLQSKSESFKDFFQKTVKSNETYSTAGPSRNESIDSGDLEELVNAKSVEEVLDLLGIEHDEGLLMVQLGEQGQAFALDELMNMNLDDLLALLNSNSQQFLNVIQQLLNDDIGNINNVWDLINLINKQAPELINQMATALQGEHKVTPKEAEQFLQFLKLIQAVGKNSDLLSDQQLQLSKLNELLQNILKEVQVTTKTTTSTQQGFRQVVQQVVQQTETTDSQNQSNTSVQTSTTTRTVSITLPPEKPAQSQALAKEIQSLLNRSQFSNSQGTMKLLLKLYPENLGSIRIELIQKDGILSARLLASTSLGKEMLDSQINQLKTAFAQQNIQMDRIDIAQSLQESDMRDQNLFSNLFKQQSEEQEANKEEGTDEESMSFSDYLEQEV